MGYDNKIFDTIAEFTSAMGFDISDVTQFSADGVEGILRFTVRDVGNIPRVVEFPFKWNEGE